MPIPGPDDYALAEIDSLARGAVQHLQTMRYRGRGPAATAAVVRMRAGLHEKLTELCAKMMAQADTCLTMTMVEPALPPPPKPRRRKIERIAKRRRK